MFSRLDIENFRSLKDFHAENLGKVNLIIGKNNAGKSTILEAIRIFAGNANRGLLELIAREHDERFRYDELSNTLPLQDFFTRTSSSSEANRAAIFIGDKKNIKDYLSMEFILLREFQETVNEGEDAPYTVIRRRRIENVSELAPHEALRRSLEITKLGIRDNIILDMPNKSARRLDKLEVTPCGVVPTRTVSMEEMAQVWDNIVFSDDEDLVREALQFLSPEFQALTFVEAEDFDPDRLRPPSYGRRRTRRVPIVKMNGIEGGHPLRSLGDGVARVFQLSLKILESKNGFLLIDEFENGFHYSVQEKIWNYIFKAAAELNIQVFATTHSWDCIESFAKASSSNKNVGTLLRVGKSARLKDDGKIIATEFYGEELSRIAQSDLEVR